MSQTHTATVPSDELARELYDVLMREIEPDLLSYNIDKLDSFYASESEEEHAVRMDRYQKAYQKFDQAFNEFMGEVPAEARASKRAALKEKEENAKNLEQEDLASLEAAFA